MGRFASLLSIDLAANYEIVISKHACGDAPRYQRRLSQRKLILHAFRVQRRIAISYVRLRLDTKIMEYKIRWRVSPLKIFRFVAVHTGIFVLGTVNYHFGT